MILLMTSEEFKDIRTYLTARKFKGMKWTQEATALELVRDKQTVYRYEKGESEIPPLVADKMKSFLREAAAEDLRASLDIALSNVHNPRDVAGAVERIKKSL